MDESKNMITELMNGIGLLTELWTIAYKGFKAQNLTDEEAIKHTQAYMSVMIREVMDASKEKK